MGVIKVVKRNGDLVEFDKQRIDDAFSKALGETNEVLEWGKYEQLINEVCDLVKDGDSVETVSDILEEKMMSYGLHKTARRFIIFREERNRERKAGKKSRYKYLSNEFLSKYKHMPNPFPTELGEFVFYRTYSRFLPEEKRREYYWETVARAVDYNCSLGKTSVKEAEQLFDNIYNLRQFLSGRTMYVGGSEVTKTSGLANFNCAGIVVDEFKKLSELFLLLMLGTGVGFRVLKDDVAKLPRIRNDIKVINKNYEPVPKLERKEHTEFTVEDDMITITIGDSRWGWSGALELYFKFLTEKNYGNINTIVINYDHVRPKGTPLKTFGGYSSGYEPLQKMFLKITNVIHKSKKDSDKFSKLKPIDLMDICGIIAQNVVSGGVRRSSLVCAFDNDDKEVYTAKKSLYTQVDGQWLIDKNLTHRSMSNNSVYFYEPPTLEEIKAILEEARYSGEPSWLFAYNAETRRPNFKLTNPCVLNTSGRM